MQKENTISNIKFFERSVLDGACPHAKGVAVWLKHMLLCGERKGQLLRAHRWLRDTQMYKI